MKLINPKNEEIFINKNSDEPIIIINNLTKIKQNKFRIKIEKNIKASLIEVFIGKNENSNYKREVFIGDNASLEYLKLQDISKESVLKLDYELILKEKANIHMTNLELGLGENQNSFTSNLDKENANLIINGLVKLYENTKSSSNFLTKHIAANCFSNINYKHSLNNSSKAIFEAKSVVEEKANFSKVLQNSDTLLLSEDAVIFARPHLEINVDELEAAHGATTGSLNEEQLLYLQARGIPSYKAKEMLLKAFENEVYDNIQNSKIKEFVQSFKRSDYV